MDKFKSIVSGHYDAMTLARKSFNWRGSQVNLRNDFNIVASGPHHDALYNSQDLRKIVIQIYLNHSGHDEIFEERMLHFIQGHVTMDVVA